VLDLGRRIAAPSLSLAEVILSGAPGPQSHNSYSERAIFPGGTVVLKGDPVTRVSVPLSML
jgi:hypothetical protein